MYIATVAVAAKMGTDWIRCVPTLPGREDLPTRQDSAASACPLLPAATHLELLGLKTRPLDSSQEPEQDDNGWVACVKNQIQVKSTRQL